MKVFLSYGHDHNRWIVEKIRDDLRSAGHEQVWFDNERIVPSDDWRRKILDGLNSSDCVLSFLSKHSVRDPGVCLDELAIALHHKRIAIVTILLEGDAEPPVSVSHIQWLDMHDWKARQAEGAPAWEAWYKGKFDHLLDILVDPPTKRFAGEIEELERLLKPVSQRARAASLIEGFVGREWLLKRLDDWRHTAPDSRLLWISGAAGTGKSAFAAWLAHFNRVNIIGLNLCEYNQDVLRDPVPVIRTLAFQIACRLHDYRALLLRRFKMLGPEPEELKQAASAFSWLLTEPLRLAIDGGRRAERFLVVIDGLDETVKDGRSALAEVLAEQARHLPEWMAIVVTGRPDDPINRQFKALNPVEITAQSPENLADLREYLGAWLPRASIPPADVAATVERIVKASDGNFLYVRMLRHAVEEGSMRLDTPEGLPGGLSALYERWFIHRFPKSADYKPFRRVISLIVAATTPVPIAWLKAILVWRIEDQAPMLRGLGSLFERRGGGVAPFHKSLRDWLIDPDAADAFAIDEAQGSEALVDALWPAFLAWAGEADHGPLDPFCVAELPAQMMRPSRDDLRGRLGAAGDIAVIWPALQEVARSQAEAYAWERALAWWRLTERLADVGVDLTVRASALFNVAEIENRVGRTEHAVVAYQQSIDARESLITDSHNDVELQQLLFVTYDRFGELLMSQGKLNSSLLFFDKSFMLKNNMLKLNQDNPLIKHDICVSYLKYGDVKELQGDRPGALESFQHGLKMLEQLVQSEHDEWRRDLSVFYDRIGDIHMSNHNLEEALASFQYGIPIRRDLLQARPADIECQYDLSVSYERVGNVLMTQRQLSEAFASLNNVVDLRKKLAERDPRNARFQASLAESFDHLGDVLVARDEKTLALEAYRNSLILKKTLTQNDSRSTTHQWSLSISLEKIGHTLIEQADLDGALQNFQESLVIREKLFKIDVTNVFWQHGVVVALRRIGQTLATKGDLLEALQKLDRGLVAIKDLRKHNLSNGDWQLELFTLLVAIGDIQSEQANPTDALANYTDALAMVKGRAPSDGTQDSWRWQRHLADIHSRIGNVLRAQSDFDGALQSYREGFVIAEQLYDKNIDDSDNIRGLAVYFERIGDLLALRGDIIQAKFNFSKTLSLREKLIAIDINNTTWQNDICWSFMKISAIHVLDNKILLALKGYNYALNILNLLAQKFPENQKWQRDLILCCVRISEVSPSEARSMLNRALQIAVKLRDDGRLAPVDAWMPDELARRLAALPSRFGQYSASFTMKMTWGGQTDDD